MVRARSLLLALLLGCSGAPGDLALPDECVDEAGLAALDLTGIWHLQIDLEGRVFPIALRVERSATGPTGLTGSIGGDAIYAVAAEGSELVVEGAWTTSGGDARRRQLRGTCVTAAGALRGDYETCTNGDCLEGQIIGHKLLEPDEPAASKMTLIGEYGGPPSGEWLADGHITVNVRVRGGMAYLARYGDGLRIVDIADPAHPVERGHLPVTFPGDEIYNDVKLVEGPDQRIYAIMASDVRGAVVIDVTDPDGPREIVTFPDPGLAPEGLPSIHTLFVEGTRAYLAFNYNDTLLIYDIRDPGQPQHIGGFAHPRLDTEGGYLHDLYVENGRAYLNYWNLGMAIVDTTGSPEAPVLVGEYTGYGGGTSHSSWVTRVGERTVAVHGDEEYGAHVRIVDVDDTSAEFLDTLGSYQTRPEVSVHNVMAHGDRAYVTYYQDGVRVLDLRDPANPVEIAHFRTWPAAGVVPGDNFYEGAIGIDFDRETGTVYVVDTHRGLLILALE